MEKNSDVKIIRIANDFSGVNHKVCDEILKNFFKNYDKTLQQLKLSSLKLSRLFKKV